MLSLLWFKRDLRVQDHPALAFAATKGSVLPVYIVEPELWAQSDASARQWGFVRECLDSLCADLAALGQPLLIRTGDAVEVLARLHARHRFQQIVSHEETGHAWSYARDLRVAEWARGKGLPWIELPQSGVMRRLGNRGHWSGRRNEFMAQEIVPAPSLPPVVEATGCAPDARALGLAEDRCPNRQRGGRALAEQALDSFLTVRGKPYHGAMSSPLGAERACSRLSPYFAFGALSLREAVQATESAKVEKRTQRDWSASLRSFESRLAWRDHFIQKLEDEPTLDTAAMHRATEGLRPRDPDLTRLRAWETGETGLPFVDACMRYLRATGWLNFRMRAMLMSVASYHLWLDWRSTGPHLARMFTDYEPGIHWCQVQLQSGATGIKPPRLCNPVKQGLNDDPQGRFIRQWLPELAPVPDAFLHEPWRWTGAQSVLGKRYPEPVVDPANAARAARTAIAAMRRSVGFRDQAMQAVAKPGGRNGRSTRKAPSAQMLLDL